MRSVTRFFTFHRYHKENYVLYRYKFYSNKFPRIWSYLSLCIYIYFVVLLECADFISTNQSTVGWAYLSFKLKWFDIESIFLLPPLLLENGPIIYNFLFILKLFVEGMFNVFTKESQSFLWLFQGGILIFENLSFFKSGAFWFLVRTWLPIDEQLT